MHLASPRPAPIARDTNREFDERLTFGQRVADRVATFGGSWTFIILFGCVLVAWIALNSWMLARRAFDPFPYILLNLMLSMIAALQAPVIMMSQNRQAAKDRLDASHDYEVNLRAELEISALHEKWDHLLRHEWAQLLETQQKQLDLLTTLVERLTNPEPKP
ncbi:MAG: DUF1003 domain-containing protein [Acidobacteria bacterium]|nr:DUF1003 domain-containing protein [Acidobacteriota bacterium]MBV9477127.1 DUF1003 domain-containing protein [Acidobacteriota bacterium]